MINEERWAVWLNSVDGSENGMWARWNGSPNATLFSSKERAEAQIRNSGGWRWTPEVRRYS